MELIRETPPCVYCHRPVESAAELAAYRAHESCYLDWCLSLGIISRAHGGGQGITTEHECSAGVPANQY